MLDPRIYRAALLPVLLALLVVAFSLEDRPRPINTTVPPDAFRANASALLDKLATDDRWIDRPAGSAGDDALADEVEARLKRTFGNDSIVHRQEFRGRTLDGDADLTNIVATRPGSPGPQIVVVAHRDAAGHEAKAELSATAALLELASIAADGRFRRTISFISTTGGSGGLAGAVEAASKLGGNVDAVLVLGDLAGATIRKPWVVPWVDGGDLAPLQLRRTVEAAVRGETGQDPGGPRALAQFTRQALGIAPTEQGVFGRAGLPAVMLSVSGERGPQADTPIAAAVPDKERARLEVFGRAALRAITALDNGPTLGGGPQAYVVTKRKLIPGWAIRLFSGALLLPVWAATLDGYARARRRRGNAGRWVAWVLATGLPFAVAAGFAVILALLGLIETAPGAALLPSAVDLDGAAYAALAVLGIVLAMGFLVIRPLAIRVAGPPPDEPPVGGGPAAGVAIVMSLLTVAIWVFNPFAAVLIGPAAHLWLFAVAPEVRIGRIVSVLLVALGFVLPLVAAVAVAGQLGASVPLALWLTVVGIGGGAVGPTAWLGSSIAVGCGLAALLVAVRRETHEEIKPDEVSSRGPLSYAGPGSLGGTDSALRR